jgi:GT2 family glycosyltransferase
MVSIILVQHNRSDLTREALRTLHDHGVSGHQVILVDNGSTEPGALSWTSGFPSLQVHRLAGGRGFGAANNEGARAANGEFLLFLNNDSVIIQEVLNPIERYFRAHPACGAIGLGLLNADGTPQNSVGKWPSILNEWKMKHHRKLYSEDEYNSVDWVTAAAVAVRREVFERIGGFDERFFMYFEDADLCRRIRNAGWEVHFVPSVRVIHLKGGSQERGMPPAIRFEYRRSQLLYYCSHATWMQQGLLRLLFCGKAIALWLKGGETGRGLSGKIIRLACSRCAESAPEKE